MGTEINLKGIKMAKYKENISDYKSDNLKYKDFQRVGNVIFNKNSANKDDQNSWLRIKEYIKTLEQK